MPGAKSVSVPRFLLLAGVLGAMLTVLSSTSCGKASETGSEAESVPVEAMPAFTLFPADRGLDFFHFNGMSGEYYFLEVFGSGAALFDYDNDGDLDAYFPQGRMLGAGKGISEALFQPVHPLPLTDRLYRNDLIRGDPESLRFTDVTEESGIRATEYGMGVAAADYDGDGWIDLYLTNFGLNQMWRNGGDGTFEDVTEETGTADPNWSVPALFFDTDRDGWLDLFVGNYVAFDTADSPTCPDLTGAADYCGPNRFLAVADRLFKNRGDGSFEEDAVSADLATEARPALGAIAADLNGDGWIDLYVANDDQPNFLWINDRGGGFYDDALLAGCALNEYGEAEASMGVDAGDFDGDGDLDLFMAHLTQETNTLYLNDGSGMFSDHTRRAGLASPSQPFTSFGGAWIDYDNDGWLDLVIVNGAIVRIPALVERGDSFPLHQPNQLLRNLGNGRFEEVTDLAGEPFRLSEVSRGAAVGDVDNDGDADILVANNSGPARLMINQVGQDSHWLGLRLVEGEPDRDALGAQAALVRSDRAELWRRVRVDGSYTSANDPRLLFGLGDDPHFDRVRVRWADSQIEEWTDLEIDRYTTLRRGTGKRVSP